MLRLISSVGRACRHEEFYPSQLSGGMKKEPVGSPWRWILKSCFSTNLRRLDPLSSRRLDDLINELKESLGITLVVVSHELGSIFEIADDSIFLDSKSQTLLQQGSLHGCLRILNTITSDPLSRGPSS